MWITPDGVRHTVALPDPTIAMTDSFLDSLDGLDEQERVLLLDAIDGESDNLLELEILETLPSANDDGLPAGYLDGHFDSATQVISYLKSRDVQWRRDAYEAVSAHLWTDDEPPTFMDNLRDLFRSLWA